MKRFYIPLPHAFTRHDVRRSGRAVAVLAASAASAALAAQAAGAGDPDFARDVQPILSGHCFHCHGPDEASRKGGLRLDTVEGAFAGGDSGDPALVAGKAAASALFQRVLTTDPDEIMPPPKEKKPLTPEQIDILRRWIDGGGTYSRHWSFVPPIRPAPPTVQSAQPAPTHPLDALVHARLAREHLSPAPPAPAETLVRRIHLDVVGLPPSPDEVRAFVAADAVNRRDAVAALVDRLLAFPAFGEKWARPWLDAARYADSNGYEKDFVREQWAWRDWVIDALNRDLPYDQFIVDQVAGDLRPGAGQDGLVATGFLANGLVNEEGAVVPEQFRTEGMFDRMDALGKSVLGLTLQCAQCHTHKFDPITHDEYFGLYAFLNNAADAQSWVYDTAALRQIDRLREDIAFQEARVQAEVPDWFTRYAAWEKHQRAALSAVVWSPLRVVDSLALSGLNHPVAQPDDSVLTLGHRTTRDEMVFTLAETPLEGATGLRLEVLTHDDLPFGGPGRSRYGTWALTELIVEAREPGNETWEKLDLTRATADFSEPEGPLEEEWTDPGADKDRKRNRGPVAFLIDGNDLTAWRADRGPGRRNADSVAVVQFATPLTRPPGTQLRVRMKNFHSGDNNGDETMMVGRFRMSLTVSPNPEAIGQATALALSHAQRTADQRADLLAAWRVSEPSLAAYTEDIEALYARWPAPRTSVLHLARRSPGLERPTHRLDRGAWDKPADVVAPHVPAFLHPLPADAPRDRLTFARWLVDRQSPLTARVAVNRVWQSIFGTGLVETAEDFGTRALVPPQAEVLDWLAVDFMETGWSVKHLIRTILTSETYQQDSRTTPEALERDPKNELLARGPRFRLEAETIRDLALASSGLLHEQLGGPSIYPPVPENLLTFNFTTIPWPVAQGPDRYRRALYVFRRRSMPDPVMASFDAPAGDVSCVRRPRSNTALAALTGLNETVFTEAACALALRILHEAPADEEARADHGFRLVIARAPTTPERSALLSMVARHRRDLAEGALDATRLLGVDAGTAPSLPDGVTHHDAAAWTLAARVLLNLDETLSKN
jgi:mono/diheme cytochrome c family protein